MKKILQNPHKKWEQSFTTSNRNKFKKINHSKNKFKNNNSKLISLNSK